MKIYRKIKKETKVYSRMLKIAEEKVNKEDIFSIGPAILKTGKLIQLTVNTKQGEFIDLFFEGYNNINACLRDFDMSVHFTD